MFAEDYDGMEKWKWGWKPKSLAEWRRYVCRRSNQQPGRSGNPHIREEPPLVLGHGQRAGIKPSLFPHALHVNSIHLSLFFSIWSLPAFALLLIHTVPSPSRATCIKCVHSVRPSSDGSYLLSSYPLAPKHFGFSSVVAFIMTSLFWLYVVSLSLTHMKLKYYLNSPPPRVSISVSPLWRVQCRAHGRCLLIFCVKLNRLYWNNTPSQWIYLQQTLPSPSHDLLLMECKEMSLHSGGWFGVCLFFNQVWRTTIPIGASHRFMVLASHYYYSLFLLRFQRKKTSLSKRKLVK